MTVYDSPRQKVRFFIRNNTAQPALVVFLPNRKLFVAREIEKNVHNLVILDIYKNDKICYNNYALETCPKRASKPSHSTAAVGFAKYQTYDTNTQHRSRVCSLFLPF